MTERRIILIQSFTLMAIVLGIMLLVPLLIGFSKGGFSVQNILFQFFLYTGIGIGGALIILALSTVEFFTTKEDATYGDGLGFATPGEIPHIKTHIFNRAFAVFLGSFITFGFLGLLANLTDPQQTFTGVGTLEQQFTKFDNLLFSSSLVAAAENLGAAALLALFIFFLRRHAQKIHLSKGNFVAISFIGGSLLVGVYGLLNHILRYSSQDIQLIKVFVFWLLGGTITMVTGSFIPFWVMHIVNNLLTNLGSSFSSDTARLYAIGILIAFIILFLWNYVLRRKSKR